MSAASATAEAASAMTSRGHDASVNPKVVPLNEAAATPRTARAVKEVLALEGISLSFGGVKALSDVDLSVNSGEIRAVIGPNGAGKSSLINVISGLYRPDPRAASIFVAKRSRLSRQDSSLILACREPFRISRSSKV